MQSDGRTTAEKCRGCTEGMWEEWKWTKTRWGEARARASKRVKAGQPARATNTLSASCSASGKVYHDDHPTSSHPDPYTMSPSRMKVRKPAAANTCVFVFRNTFASSESQACPIVPPHEYIQRIFAADRRGSCLARKSACVRAAVVTSAVHAHCRKDRVHVIRYPDYQGSISRCLNTMQQMAFHHESEYAFNSSWLGHQLTMRVRRRRYVAQDSLESGRVNAVRSVW